MSGFATGEPRSVFTAPSMTGVSTGRHVDGALLQQHDVDGPLRSTFRYGRRRREAGPMLALSCLRHAATMKEAPGLHC